MCSMDIVVIVVSQPVRPIPDKVMNVVFPVKGILCQRERVCVCVRARVHMRVCDRNSFACFNQYSQIQYTSCL